jgi:transposase
MTNEDELARLRLEARKLRQENATLEHSQNTQKDNVGKWKEIAEERKEKIDELTEENSKLEKEVAGLKIRLGIIADHAKKLAGMIFKSNSGKPATGSKRGAKKGHKGVGRKKPETADQEIDVFLTNCHDCGNPLNRTSSVDERLVEDIPKTSPIITRYHIERQWCAHCHKEVRGIPQNTIPGCRFGTGVVVLVLFLKYRMRSPLKKIEEMLLSQHGIIITGQGIQELLHNIKTKFNKQYNDILKEIRNAPIKHADETSFRIDGINGWCWLFATPSASLYTIEETRGKEVPKRILGHDPTGLLVRDDYAGYTSLPLPQQSCWSHLLRVSHEAFVHEKASDEIRALHMNLKRMFGELSSITLEPFNKAQRKKAYEKYSKQITLVINRKYESDDVKAVQTRIANQKTNLITALLHENAPLTNNHAERMIRPMVITRKISGGSRSDKGAATHAVNMSVIQTLVLKGKDFFESINEILHDGNKRYALGNGG